jgi:hypothetical protein
MRALDLRRKAAAPLLGYLRNIKGFIAIGA